MYIKNGTCENKVDAFGNKPKMFMTYFKRINFGLFKIWLGYELYHLIDKNKNILIKDKKGNPIQDKYLFSIEIKPFWKK